MQFLSAFSILNWSSVSKSFSSIFNHLAFTSVSLFTPEASWDIDCNCYLSERFLFIFIYLFIYLFWAFAITSVNFLFFRPWEIAFFKFTFVKTTARSFSSIFFINLWFHSLAIFFWIWCLFVVIFAKVFRKE